jgi:uncharacterized protein YigA (DUF484 family)
MDSFFHEIASGADSLALSRDKTSRISLCHRLSRLRNRIGSSELAIDFLSTFL